MKKSDLILVAILTILIAFMDISGIPSTLFVSITVADIDPIYFALMVNFLIIGAIAFLYLRFLCPEWKLGLGKDGLADGLKKYGLLGVGVALAGFVAFLVGSLAFLRDTFSKVYLPLKMQYSALFLRDVYRTYEVVNDFYFLRIVRKLFFFADFDSVHKRIKNFLR